MILTAPLVEGYGGRQERDWANARQRTVLANVQPAQTTTGQVQESTDNRDLLVGLLRLDLGPQEDIAATDRVRLDGADWDVQGLPQLWRLQGVPHHWEVVLRRTEEPST